MKQIGIILLVGLLVIGTEAWPSPWNTNIVKRDANGADDKEDVNAISSNGNDDKDQDKNNSNTDVKVDSRDVVSKTKAGNLNKVQKMKERKRKEYKKKFDDLANAKREKNCGKLEEKMENQRDRQGTNAEEDQSRMKKCSNKKYGNGRRRKNKNKSNDRKERNNEDSGKKSKHTEGNGKNGKKNENSGQTEKKNGGRKQKEKENKGIGKIRKEDKVSDKGEKENRNKKKGRFQRKKAGKD